MLDFLRNLGYTYTFGGGWVNVDGGISISRLRADAVMVKREKGSSQSQ